ncbi:MAG: hypothetical protein HY289_11315 [Planctomycetes bacterium]|nr:hypothetical protein [Planctomycetota bacterium]
MNKNNDTSFQAGEPMPAQEPIANAETLELEIARVSQLDRAAAAIKGYEWWGLAAGVGLQLLVLLAMTMMGAFNFVREGM